jgi:hypothetical protein
MPSPDNTGVPQGWSPTKTVTGDYIVETPGAVIEDLRVVNGQIIIEASDVTIRNTEVVNGHIVNPYCDVNKNVILDHVSVIRGPGLPKNSDAAIGVGDITAKFVKIDGWPEGFRAGSREMGCGGLNIENSFVRILPPVNPPYHPCGNDWHGDGLQAHGAGRSVIRRSTFVLVDFPDCGGTAPIFWADGDPGTVFDTVLVAGGGYSLRVSLPSQLRNVMIVNDGWHFGPVTGQDCSVVKPWDVKLVTVDKNYQVTSVVGGVPC